MINISRLLTNYNIYSSHGYSSAGAGFILNIMCQFNSDKCLKVIWWFRQQVVHSWVSFITSYKDTYSILYTLTQ